MSGAIAGQIRSAAGKLWFDRFDVAGFGRFCRSVYGPLKTADRVAVDTGLPVDSVKKWLSGEAVPNGRSLLALLCVYGPDLAHAMLNGVPAWMSSAARIERGQQLEREIADRIAELDTLAKGRE